MDFMFTCSYDKMSDSGILYVPGMTEGDEKERWNVYRSFDCAQDDRWMGLDDRGDCHVAGLLAMTWR